MSKQLTDGITPIIDKIVAKSAEKSQELVDEIIDYAEQKTTQATPRSNMTLKRRQQLYRDPAKQADRQLYYTKPLHQSFIQSKLTGHRRAAPKKSLHADKDNGWRIGFVIYNTPNYKANNYLDKVIDDVDKKGLNLIKKGLDEVMDNDT